MARHIVSAWLIESDSISREMQQPHYWARDGAVWVSDKAKAARFATAEEASEQMSRLVGQDEMSIEEHQFIER